MSRIGNSRMQDSMTHENERTVIVKINALAWHEGMTWALRGGSTFENPYALGSEEAYSWISGFIETANSNEAA